MEEQDKPKGPLQTQPQTGPCQKVARATEPSMVCSGSRKRRGGMGGCGQDKGQV